jgi:catechol 2,3-dioxygenase-like lactoylglutathione lyase family enzyme
MEVLSSRILIRPVDVARSTAFYRDVLGLAVFREFPGGTVFFAGQGLLEVSSHVAGAPASGSTAILLQVRDIKATFEELRERKVAIVREPRVEPWGLHEGWIADPDGLPIVFVEVPADHPQRVDQRPAP